MSDYRIEVKVKNNNILRKLEESGYTSVGEFCRKNGSKFSPSLIGNLVNLKRSPLRKDGQYLAAILMMCEVLQCAPEDLFSDVQMTTELESNKRTMQVREAEMQFMLHGQAEPMSLEQEMDRERLEVEMDELLSSLTPREADVISMRFGLGEYSSEHTFAAIAKKQDVTASYVREIESKALRKLRHPSRAEGFRKYIMTER